MGIIPGLSKKSFTSDLSGLNRRGLTPPFLCLLQRVNILRKMRVKSNFKDYYDYVEFIYSPKGGDRSETYLRGRIKDIVDLGKEGESNGELSITLRVKGAIPGYPVPKFGNSWEDWEEFPWRFRWCSFCGKLYLLVADWSSENLPAMGPLKVIREDHPALDKVRTANFWGWKNEKLPFESIFALPNEACLEISKRLNEPVFFIESFSELKRTYNRSTNIEITSSVVVQRQVPNLGSLGFPTFLPPEQAYQEISMFLGQLKDNPDKNLPVNVSDKDRLVQKGFDSKLSFRGKPPP